MSKATLIFGFIAFPIISLAQADGAKGIIQGVGGMISLLIPITAGVSLLFFFWGLAKFILKAGGDEKAREEGKQVMKWGIVALFVLVSIWGIVLFLRSEFGIADITNLQI